ncbi:MAG: hypothetical protein ACYS5V_03215 [Planctomycetota bacterium]|jgi:hypothetical protein
MTGEDDIPPLCHRCGAELTPGQGDFYVVRITAVADPTPPAITDADLARDIQAEIEELLRSLDNKSEQELLDGVYRRMTIHLCTPCYTRWIEDPAGTPDSIQ